MYHSYVVAGYSLRLRAKSRVHAPDVALLVTLEERTPCASFNSNSFNVYFTSSRNLKGMNRFRITLSIVDIYQEEIIFAKHVMIN